jgi:Ankyrin repeats (3 copies)
MQLLLDGGAKVDAQDNNNLTLLHLAICHGHVRVVTLLIERYANIHHRDGKGKTPLHFASYSRNPRIMQLLLYEGAKVEVDAVDAQDNDNSTLPHLAACHGQKVEAVTLLVKHNADIHAKRGRTG